MYTLEESKALYLKKLNKTKENLTPEEWSILNCIIYDCTIGRYSKFLMWTPEKHKEFIDWVASNLGDGHYSNLSNAERWAYEDAFDM